MKYYYYFQDWDDETGEELRIADGDYSILIDLCFKYASSFSLSFLSHQLQGAGFPLTPYQVDGPRDEKVCCHFKCSDEAKRFLKERVHDFFGWVYTVDRNTPEDLTFYRNDSSVFLWSQTHEGICALFPHHGEDVSACISKPGWHKQASDVHHLLIPKNVISASMEP